MRERTRGGGVEIDVEWESARGEHERENAREKDRERGKRGGEIEIDTIRESAR